MKGKSTAYTWLLIALIIIKCSAYLWKPYIERGCRQGPTHFKGTVYIMVYLQIIQRLMVLIFRWISRINARYSENISVIYFFFVVEPTKESAVEPTDLSTGSYLLILCNVFVSFCSADCFTQAMSHAATPCIFPWQKTRDWSWEWLHIHLKELMYIMTLF